MARKLSERELIAKRLKLAVNDLSKNTDPKQKAALVAECWDAFVGFFDEFMAGEVKMPHGKTTIKRIRE